MRTQPAARQGPGTSGPQICKSAAGVDVDYRGTTAGEVGHFPAVLRESADKSRRRPGGEPAVDRQDGDRLPLPYFDLARKPMEHRHARDRRRDHVDVVLEAPREGERSNAGGVNDVAVDLAPIRLRVER